MKHFVTILISLSLLATAADVGAQQHLRNCLSDPYYKELIQLHPELYQERQRANELLENYLSKHNGSISFREDIVIPVVVHVVYRLPEQNISNQQVISQIDALNRDFNLENGNRFQVPEQFKSVMSDVGIEFCLAGRDPDGQATTGIVRRETNVENIGTAQGSDGRTAIHHDELGGSDAWDEEHYLNIWVGELGGYLGIGKYPGAALPGEDGVIVDYKYFGTLGTALNNRPFHKGKTTAHEVGHYLNLLHPWGLIENECSEGDRVDDTPDQSNPNYFCPKQPIFSCGSQDMFYNYMDYTDDPCLAVFTEGQKQRIMATLQSLRSGLLQSDGCTYTPGPMKLAERFKVYFRSSDRRLLIEREHTDALAIDLKVYNQLGQLVARASEIDQRIFIIDQPVQSSGIYFVELSSNSESVLHKVVAIQ